MRGAARRGRWGKREGEEKTKWGVEERIWMINRV